MKPSANSYICDLNPYLPGLPTELVAKKYGLKEASVIKLASNENPLGMSPKAEQAVRANLADAFRYPEQHALVHALAKKHQLSEDQVVIGNGSNDVLDLIARTYLKAGDNAVSSQYAFAVYAIATQSTGAKNIIVPAIHYGHDIPSMLAAITPATKVIWIVNPNNPTGTLTPYDTLKNAFKQIPPHVVIVLDEAYYEYLVPKDRVNSIAWLKEFPNLIIVRTFSKAYGLAGIRLGYGFAAPEIIDLLNRVRQPFNVSRIATTAGIAALDDDAFLTASYQANEAGKIQLQKGLDAQKLTYIPTYGNFIAFEIDNAAAINESLLKQGVIIRPLAGYGMTNWLRVSIGTTAENQRFLLALSAAVVECRG